MSTAAPRLDGQIVLAVFAHPDDESLACGGTLARLAAAGAHVVVMCASHGERGSHIGPVRNDALGRERAGEMRDAADALGVAEVRLLSHPDGELRWAEVTGFSAEIVLFLRRYRPAAVITFGEDGLYWHPDHIGVHERVLTAVRALGPDAPPLYYVTMPHGVMPEIVDTARARGWAPPVKGFWSITPESFGLLAEPHTIEVNVEEWVERKLAGILAHKSQMGDGHPFANLDPADARRWLGREFFRRADLAGRPGAILEQLCT
ncbi:MAG: PIG-L deacetylase family protein [Vicinamibacterales bacterium]